MRLVELWLRDKSPETRKAYAQDLERFFDFSGGKPLSSVPLADLQELTEFVSVLVAPATDARMLSTLKSARRHHQGNFVLREYGW